MEAMYGLEGRQRLPMPVTAISIPLILYDANVPGELERAEEFGNDILRLCVEVGGVLTGEHGVGVEKARPHGHDVRQGRPRPAATAEMRLRSGRALLNPGKVFPQLCQMRRTRPRPCACGDRRASPICHASRRSVAMTTFRPTDTADLREIVASAAAEKQPLDDRRRRQQAEPWTPRPSVDRARAGTWSAFDRVIDYEPSELVLTAEAATPMRRHRGATDRPWPDAGLRAAGLARAAGVLRRAHARRHDRLQPRGPAASAGRRSPGPLPRLLGRQRLGRGLEGRRPALSRTSRATT